MNNFSPLPQPLWPDGTAFGPLVVPPTLTRFNPPEGRDNGGSVVVCPGGGYSVLADHEAAPVAEWLASLGITAFVLHYRLGPHSRHPAMLDDAARAVQTVRAGAATEGRDPNRVGILGFSAGGHLASTLATHYDAGDPNAADPLARVSSRPDLAVLVYPVITLQEPHGHAWCRTQLLGDPAENDLTALLSNHRHVSAETPPMFLVHSADDQGVPPENSLLLALALSAAHVPFELHLYERGGHGYGLGGDDPVLQTWPDRCRDWLRGRGFIQLHAVSDNRGG